MELIKTYFPDLTKNQIKQFEALYDVYQEWNAMINVISRKDSENLYLKHVLHSLSIAKIIEFNPGSQILDIGTGGGFPGIPLAILYPEVQFYLIDSIAKKIKVVNAVIETIGLHNVAAKQENAKHVKKKFDFVVTRAVAPLKDLVNWSKPLLKNRSHNKFYNGLICLKGGNVDEEIKEIQLSVTKYPIEALFKEEFFKEKQVLYVRMGNKK